MHAEEPPPVPNYWLYHPTPLSRNAGLNRYVWDLRCTAPDAIQHTYPISALYESTHAEPQGPFVVPGKYEVRLTVDGKTYTQPLTVTMDPRVQVTATALQQQVEFGQTVDRLISLSYAYHEQAAKFLEEIGQRTSVLQVTAQQAEALKSVRELDAKARKLQGQMQRGFGGFGKPKPTFTLMNSELSTLSESVNQADAAPTDAMRTAYHDYCQDLTKVAQQWSELMKNDLPGVNTQLTQQKLQPLIEVTLVPAMPNCP
jgi:hypothetical protein